MVHNFSISSYHQKSLPKDRAVQVILHRVVTLIVFNAFRQAEVSNLHRALVLHQDIPSSQVSVDVIPRAQIIHTLK